MKTPKIGDRWLEPLLFTVGEVPQASTGFPPFELLYGRQPRAVLDVLREAWEDGPSDSKNEIQYVMDLRTIVHTLGRLSRENLLQAQDRQSRLYNRGARLRQFTPGDKVLVLLPTSSSELLAKWQGPFEVTRRVGDLNYEVACTDRGGAHQIYHLNLLKNATYTAFASYPKEAERGRAHGQPEEVCNWAGGSLGFHLGHGQVRPQIDKTAAVATCPRPMTKKEVRQFLGLAGYYRRFVPNFSDAASPLTDLTKKEAPDTVQWTERCQQAFTHTKAARCGGPLLHAPDFSLPLILQTDASDRGLAAVLSQEVEGEERPVLYISCKLSKREMMRGAAVWMAPRPESGGGGVVLRSLQRERGDGTERSVSRSSADDDHLCLISVIDVERLDISRRVRGNEREREMSWDLVCPTVERDCKNSELLCYWLCLCTRYRLYTGKSSREVGRMEMKERYVFAALLSSP
ncbi:hypothetical protein F2P79_016387 [Pimephales promelas]|nr:hypothetical protein F2P79_016387 [Pimephales promelas]